MLPLKRILVLACAFSIMAAPPVQTLPTAAGTNDKTPASPAPPSTEPTTLLGRHYSLSRREPLLLMPSPMLDGALEGSREKKPDAEPMAVPEKEKPKSEAAPFPMSKQDNKDVGQYNAYPQDKAPAPAPPPQNQPPPPAQAQAAPNPNSTGKPGNSTSSAPANARRMVPYPRYLLERTAVAEHQKDHYPRMDANTDSLPHVGPGPAPAAVAAGASPTGGQPQNPAAVTLSNG